MNCVRITGSGSIFCLHTSEFWRHANFVRTMHLVFWKKFLALSGSVPKFSCDDYLCNDPMRSQLKDIKFDSVTSILTENQRRTGIRDFLAFQVRSGVSIQDRSSSIAQCSLPFFFIPSFLLLPMRRYNLPFTIQIPILFVISNIKLNRYVYHIVFAHYKTCEKGWDSNLREPSREYSIA